MIPETRGRHTAASDSTQIGRHGSSRVAFVRYSRGGVLTNTHGTFLLDTLAGRAGPDREPLTMRADADGPGETDT
jgi:hypothetical protein